MQYRKQKEKKVFFFLRYDYNELRNILRNSFLMPRRKTESESIRKITKVGGQSYAVTIPIEIIRKLSWRERQKVVVTEQNGEIIIRDWEK